MNNRTREYNKINRFLYEAMGKGCWHDIDLYVVKGQCSRCDAADVSVPDIDYCSSLDAVAVVEKFIISQSNSHRATLNYHIIKLLDPAESPAWLATAAVFASAEIRAKACMNAICEG